MLGPTEDALGVAGENAARRGTGDGASQRAAAAQARQHLLDFSRIEAGRVTATFEPTDLAALTADLASAFRSATERAGLQLVVDCPPLPTAVYVDREMWEKIVLNLLSNAFKFTFEGSIGVAVAATDTHVELRVRDTGIGIAPHDLARVFDRFHRIERTAARTHEGSGIGLALVRELVAIHGGTVDVASVLGARHGVHRASPARHRASCGASGSRRSRADVMRPSAPLGLGATPYVEEALRWLPADDAGRITDRAARADRHDGQDSGRRRQRRHARLLVAPALRALPGRIGGRRHGGAGGGQASPARRHRQRRDDARARRISAARGAARRRGDPHDSVHSALRARGRGGAHRRAPRRRRRLPGEAVLRARADRARRAQLVRAKMRSLEEAQAVRLASVFAHAPVGIAILKGAEHVFEFANRRYLDLIGGRPVVGKPIREALPELEGQGIYELLDGVYQSGEPFVGRSVRADDPASAQRPGGGVLRFRLSAAVR